VRALCSPRACRELSPRHQRAAADLRSRIEAVNGQLPSIMQKWSAWKRARSRSALLSGAALASADYDSEMT
jgi:hypothetical protein